MVSNPTTSISARFGNIITKAGSFALSIFLFYLILQNRSPNLLRPLSMALRTGFGLVIPITIIVLYLAFRIPGWFGNLVSMAVTLVFFAMPLAGLWASGQTQSTVLNGLIPLYDAELYYIDALRLINGLQFSIFSARRPLFPGLLAVLLSWTNHNLMVSLAILTAIAGLACYFAAREIQRTHGPEIATFVLIILFLFFRAHSGISMSENLGMALGVLGFALLWQGASRGNILHLCYGLLTTTLALNARAGAFFMLPILVLWIGWLFRVNKRFSWRSMVYASIAILLGFTLNLILTRIIAIPSGVPFSNFSYTLYGLASGGKSWAYIFVAHPEVLAIPEPEQTKRIYQLAFDLIKTYPFQIIQGALLNWKMLFSNSWYSIYSYVGGENWTINRVAHWVLYFLGFTGLYAWLRDHNDPIKSLIVVSFFGVLISVPFLPPTDAYRMRPYAASIIILAALPALGFSFILNNLKLKFLHKNISISTPHPDALIFSSILILVTLIAPPIILVTSTRPIFPTKVSCTDHNSDYVITHFDEGTYINIKKQNLSFLDWMPDYHVGQFKENAHSLPDIELIKWTASLQPPITLFTSLDLISQERVLVAFKTEKAPTSGKYYQFCGNFETLPSLNSLRVFYADEALPLSP